MPPSFIYFDLGRVLVDFNYERMFNQMAAVAGIGAEKVREVIIDRGLQLDYESGRYDPRGFCEEFCRLTGTRPDCEALLHAGADIFFAKLDTPPIVERLYRAGHRLGVLSNTCASHWQHCLRHYPMITEWFAVHALSYEIGCCKPDAPIFHRAAELAGCRPEEIFYTDDIAGHVAGAKAVGYDAVVFTSAEELTEELRGRGVAV